MPIPDEVSKLIRNSGNNFHAKVTKWLVENGWHVVVSPYYMDQSQGKAREIDLVAEKLWPIMKFGRCEGNYVAVRLFIECKYIPSYSVFWFAEKDTEAAKQLVCSYGPFRQDNMYTDKHHYLSTSERVAKLFASSASKAVENEPFYKALNQALNGLVSMRGQPVTIPIAPNRRRSVSAILEYPVVVCSSFEKLFATDFYGEAPPVPVSENFQLEVRYAYIDRLQNQRDDYFLLDFVGFDKLGGFMENIDEDATAAAYLAS